MSDSTTPQVAASKLVPKPSPRYHVNMLHALALRQKGLSLREISAQMNMPASTLRGHFDRLGAILDTPDKLQVYETGRSSLLSATESRYLDAVLHADLSKTSAKDKAIVYGILYDKGRLERGKATAHVAVLAGLIAHSDKALFVRSDHTPGAVLHKSHTIDVAAQPVVATDVVGIQPVAVQGVVLHQSHIPHIVVQHIVCDTPTTPTPRGTGGLDVCEAAVDLHDLQVVESDLEDVDFTEEKGGLE